MARERRQVKGFARACTLGSDISAAATTITLVGDYSGWPDGSTGKFGILIDRGGTQEAALGNARTLGTITLASSSDRGVDDTSAAEHRQGVSVEHGSIRRDYDEANELVAGLNTWTAYTPAYAGLGSMTVVEASHASNHRRYLTVGKMCFVSFSQLLTFGGTRQSTFTISLPVAAAKPRQTFDGDLVNAVARCSTIDSTTTVLIGTYDGSTIAAGDFHTSFHGWYEIA